MVMLVTCWMAWQGRRVEFDASIKSFILENDPDYEHYMAYRKKFGQDEILVVAFEARDIFQPRELRLIRRLSERIADMDNIYDVRSLTNVEYMRNNGDCFEVVPLIDEIPEDQKELAKARQIALANPLFREDLISNDGRKTSILITLAAMEPGYRYEKEIEGIERIVTEESAQSGVTLHLAGERYLDQRFLRYMHRDLSVLVPVTLLVLGLVMFLLFRNLRETVIGLVAVAVCLVWIGGMVPLAGWKMNAVTVGLPSLVLCIAVTDVVHIIHRYREILSAGGERRAALESALREVSLPCFLTSLTTAIGFGALVLNEIHPIQGFGILAAMGVSSCYPICMTVVPSLIVLWNERDKRVKTRGRHLAQRAMHRLAEVLAGRRRRILTGVAALFVLALFGMSAITIQVDRTRYLKKKSDVRQSIDFIDRHLAGTTQLDVSLDIGDDDAVKNPEVLRRIEEFSQYLRARPEIDKVISINDFLKDMNQALNMDKPEYYRLPDRRDMVAQLLLIYAMSGSRNELNKYVDYPYSRTRISVRTSEQNSACLDALITDMEGYLAANFPSQLNARMASVAIANNNVFHYLLKGLLLGLGTAIFVVAIVMCVTFRSVRVGLICMVPNLVPVFACLGLMGWCGIWLEIATAMTFSIALGIAVDDTIHFLSRYKLELSRCGDQDAALRATLANVGPALMQTTLIIVGGFLVLMLASLKMNIMFGLLSAFIMLVTLGADLVVTPLCLMLFRPFRRVIDAKKVTRSPGTQPQIGEHTARRHGKREKQPEELLHA